LLKKLVSDGDKFIFTHTKIAKKPDKTSVSWLLASLADAAFH